MLAPRSHRLFGQVLDGIVGAAPWLIAMIVASFSDVVGYPLILAAMAWSVFYYLFADGLHEGQSLGKQMLGMRVVALDGIAPCTFRQSFVRNLLLAVLGPLDWLFIFGDRHQRLGDKLAATLVVSV